MVIEDNIAVLIHQNPKKIEIILSGKVEEIDKKVVIIALFNQLSKEDKESVLGDIDRP